MACCRRNRRIGSVCSRSGDMRKLKAGLEIFRNFSADRWFTRKPPRDAPEVPVPPLKDDEWHCMTVLPYLVDHYYDDSTEDTSNVQFYTEHQLNGMSSTFKCRLV